MVSKPTSTDISACSQRWDVVASRLEAHNLAPEVHAIIEEAVCFRDRGLLQESVSRLQALPTTALDNVAIRNELALSYILQHNFGKVLTLMGPLKPLHTDTRDHGFTQMLLDYTLIHTDLMLAEAVKSSTSVYQGWLAEREVEDYDDLDLYMACLYYEIQELGRRFLNGDDWEDIESPAEEPLRKLRLHILKAHRVEEFLFACAIETILLSRDEISIILQDVLTQCRQGNEGSLEGISLRCLDVEARIHLLLSRNLSMNQQSAQVDEHLQMARKIFSHTGNNHGSLWAQLYMIEFREGEVDMLLVDALKELAGEFEKVEDWKAVQICMFRVARVYQQYGGHALYHSALRLLFQSQIEIKSSDPGYFSMPCILHARQQTFRRHCHGSMFDFWKRYLDLLPEDIRTLQHVGILIHFCSIFFVVHPDCSIMTLRHLLAMTLSEQYDIWLHDGQQALMWAQMALECAEQDESKAEAYHQIRMLLAGDGVRAMDDPYGDKQQELDAAKGRDLAVLFQEEAESGHFLEQFETALQLLRMQLTTEVKTNTTLSGDPWLEKASLVLPRLPIDERHDGKLQIDYAMAHALFESGNFSKAVTALTSLTAQCDQKKSKGLRMKSRAMFTLGRTYMQIYKRRSDQIHWEQSREALETALRLSSETSDTGAVACCHCMLAELWRGQGFEDQGNVKMALHHVTEAERLWSEERRNIENLSGLNGLLTRYAVRNRGESGPSDVFAIALDACFGNGDFEEAWIWTQKAKARAFIDSLDAVPGVDQSSRAQATGMLFNGSDEFTRSLQGISREQGGVVYVDWVTADDTIYMLTVRHGETPRMHILDISLSSVQQWYADLCDAQDDLSGADAEQTLSELDALCEPLAQLDVAPPGALLVLCPTKVLFNIPLHALNAGGKVLLERNPVVYTHSLSVLLRCFMEDRKEKSNRISHPFAFFADPTGDTSGGVESLTTLGDSMPMETFCGVEATRDRFASSCHSSRLVHYHGHIVVDEHPLNHTMLFHHHDSEHNNAERHSELSARNVFSWTMKENSPFICLIGCGSGKERIQTGDEPLGFTSSFIYAGASAVLVTLWPIHDLDSGSIFSQLYYEPFSSRIGEGVIAQPRVVNLARSLQRAALEIRSKEDTRAPYFWAGFVLHGMWNFEL